MSFTPENIAEIELLMLFDLSTSQAGIKIHKEAKPDAIAAAQSLFAKGFITQKDGGYLTQLGLVAAEHTQTLATLLNSSNSD